MIVGVFGDSYAAGYNPSSWTEILRRKYDYQIKNYARDATSLFWSFRELKTVITEVDTVVFVVTGWGRLFYSDARYNICTLANVKTSPTNKFKLPDRKEIYHAAEQYFLYLDNVEFNLFVHEQIISAIKAQCEQHQKRLILIPTTELDAPHQTVFQTSLIDVTRKELKTQFNTTHPRLERMTRPNHMSLENNLILAQMIDELLQNKRTQVSLDEFVFNKVNDPENFWMDI
jgi:hypothetical protein